MVEYQDRNKIVIQICGEIRCDARPSLSANEVQVSGSLLAAAVEPYPSGAETYPNVALCKLNEPSIEDKTHKHVSNLAKRD
jgi:hypothetical protein